MYPFLRLAKDLWITRNAPPLEPFETHVSQHICWPWDLDFWNELNNGRTLTLYDLGRIPMARRAGLIAAMKRERWGLAIAGASVRYRRRVHGMERIEMRSRLLCWDARFMYIEQSMWKRTGDCASHALYRAAVTDRNGIVGTDRVRAAIGVEGEAPEVPTWVRAWIDAEDARPWPPMQD
ncbi:acyl-CoA thioesterase [Thalassococcus profundi]|uniref:Acyl-CoA thioesterase n=1 Tax=Thalassococcus profundi TaxID=2282382 RepID=A0A369TT72_9RHOB|nr:acyl-CoA thioesterase [Thalassococcus profundi]RDD68092.1 acyl-CoA thioesterase [Thalassococcus profundi]